MPKDTPAAPPATLLDSDLSEMSKNETLKLESQGLFCDGSVRLTTRQGIQFHYVTAPALGPLIRFLNRVYPSTGYQMSTLAACGDVNRNTMCCVVDDLIPELPLQSRELAYGIAMEL